MPDCWTNALYPHRPTILGRRLYPVSVAHCLVLWAAGSPLIGASRRGAELEDVLLAIYLLSVNPGRVVAVSRSGRRVRMACWWWGLWHSRKLIGATAQITDYIMASTAYPAIWTDPSRGKERRPSGIPWPWALLWILMERMPRAEAMDLPVSEAIALAACRAGENGVEFVSVEQSEEGAAIEAELEAAMAQRTAKKDAA